MLQRLLGRTKKKINLALQGGGAHGAFTWGVLDHLLEDGRIHIAGVSGASAGAMNAVMLADGLARGGGEEARKRLAEFWRAASIGGNLPGAQRAVLDRLLALMPVEASPVRFMVDTMSRVLSPYDLNPLNINPLKALIERFVDFDAVRGFKDLDIFISATNVQSGRLRVFKREEISADVVMASAALPSVFRAVEIDGEPYWDGGFTGNPPILPLIEANEIDDVLVVQISPVSRDGTPTSARDIAHRVNEITFNSSLDSELRALEYIGRHRRQAQQGRGACESRQSAPHRARQPRQEARRRNRAQRRLRLFRPAAPRRPPRRAALPGRAFRRYRAAFDARPDRDFRRERLKSPHGPC